MATTDVQNLSFEQGVVAGFIAMTEYYRYRTPWRGWDKSFMCKLLAKRTGHKALSFPEGIPKEVLLLVDEVRRRFERFETELCLGIANKIARSAGQAETRRG